MIVEANYYNPIQSYILIAQRCLKRSISAIKQLCSRNAFFCYLSQLISVEKRFLEFTQLYNFIEMSESPKKQSQASYLQDLFAHHSSSISLFSDLMVEKQAHYEQKIREGQYQIRKASFSLGSNSHLDQKSIDKLRKNRDQLSSQLQSLSISMKNDLKSQMSLSQQERKKFVKQMIHEQKKLNIQKQQKRRAEETKRLQSQERRKKEQQMMAGERAQQKRKQIQRRLSELEQQKQRRAQEMKYRNRQVKQIASEKILMHRMVQNYNKLQNTTLEEKKKKLAAIRQIHKPMSKQEFQEHLQRINQYKQLVQQERQQKEIMRQSKITQSTIRFYKSKWHKEVLKEQKIDQNKVAQEERQALRQQKDKQKKYAEYIRQNFVPQSDDKLMEDIAKRIPEPIARKKSKQIRQMGLNNLRYSKEKIMPKQQMEEKSKQKQKTVEPIQSRPKNYLEQLKSNRKNSSLNTKFFQKADKWTVSPHQIKNYAENLQFRAKKKEELKRLGKTISDEQLDELYIRALDAKLNLLKKQNK